MNLKDELNLAIKLSKEAGREILDIYHNKDFNIEYKDDDSPLTEADKRANQVIVPALKEIFKEFAILSEESKDNRDRLENDWCWVVDPLDGTKEFIKRNDEFTVNIALTYNQESVLGVIYVPVTDELYYAVKGNGAYYKASEKTKANKITVSDRRDDLRVVKSRSHASDELQSLLDAKKEKIEYTKEAGSSIKGCLIARGEAEVYYRFNPTMEWDTAAMDIIVREAGGIIRNLKTDEQMKYNLEDNLNGDGFYVLNDVANKF